MAECDQGPYLNLENEQKLQTIPHLYGNWEKGQKLLSWLVKTLSINDDEKKHDAPKS